MQKLRKAVYTTAPFFILLLIITKTAYASDSTDFHIGISNILGLARYVLIIAGIGGFIAEIFRERRSIAKAAAIVIIAAVLYFISTPGQMNVVGHDIYDFITGRVHTTQPTENNAPTNNNTPTNNNSSPTAIPSPNNSSGGNGA